MTEILPLGVHGMKIGIPGMYYIPASFCYQMNEFANVLL